MEVTVHLTRDENGVFHQTEDPSAADETFVAVWKLPLKKNWDLVSRRSGKTPLSPFELEFRAWLYMLESFSHFEGEIHDSRGVLKKEYIEQLSNIVPPFLPTKLARPLLESVSIKPGETREIEYQCQVLWLGQGSKLYNPHPLMETAIVAMTMQDQYGVPIVADVGELHMRDYLAFRMVAQAKGEMMDINKRTRALHKQARQESGMDALQAQSGGAR